MKLGPKIFSRYNNQIGRKLAAIGLDFKWVCPCGYQTDVTNHALVTKQWHVHLQAHKDGLAY